MAWGKIDDNLALHPKVLMAGNEAMGLWVRSLSWSMQLLTDGRIPNKVIRALDGVEVAPVLVEVGLWHPTEDGYEFNDWCDYQPTREQVMGERQKTAERQRKWKEKSAATALSNGVSNGVTNGVTNGVANGVTNSAPTRPDPTPNKELINDRFEEFWDAWPRKVNKANALKAWEKATAKTSPYLIIGAAMAYGESPYKPEVQFIPHASTWLNGERWNDPLPEAPEANPFSTPLKPVAAVPYVPSHEELLSQYCSKHPNWPVNACERCAEERAA